jgi:hypothetical protein
VQVSEGVRETSERPVVAPAVVEPLQGTKRRLFLSSDDEERSPKKAKGSTVAVTPTRVPKDRRSPSPTVEPASPSPEPEVVDLPSAKRRRGKGGSAVSEMDMTPQAITKHGYSGDAYLLNSRIYIGVRSAVFASPGYLFADMSTSMRPSFAPRCVSGAPGMVTIVVGMRARLVGDAYAIARPVFRPKVCAPC